MFQRTSTQMFLEVSQIRKGVVILKNKALRTVVLISSTNFALKSEQEQDAVIYQFQSFLNSLDFPIQIFIQSQRLNISRYLQRIKEAKDKQQNKLLKAEAIEYYKFIQAIVGTGVIMKKNFYLIIPFEISVAKGGGIGDIKTSFIGQKKIQEKEFERFRHQLFQRRDFVLSGIRRCGLQGIPLNSRELIELYWSVHNPREAEIGFCPEVPPELME
jgi:hypothetical protein